MRLFNRGEGHTVPIQVFGDGEEASQHTDGVWLLLLWPDSSSGQIRTEDPVHDSEKYKEVLYSAALTVCGG